MRILLAAAALVTAAPSAAQDGSPAQPAPAAGAAAEPADPARLALARTAVDSVWPIGTYARMMRGTMDAMSGQMLEAMFDVKLGDVVPPEEAKDPKLAGLTMREAMMKEDPHFMERMKIMNRVMLEEMIPVMSRLEPSVREGLARAYARRFTAEQLSDINRFFATPSGRVYASESLLAFMDPEIMAQMAHFTPELIKEMPRIMEKVKAATAHLPPPPAPKAERRRR